VAYDQQGLVFAVGLDNGLIKLFDAGNYDSGPFETFTVRLLSGCMLSKRDCANSVVGSAVKECAAYGRL
jgi:hypothetical protein